MTKAAARLGSRRVRGQRQRVVFAVFTVLIVYAVAEFAAAAAWRLATGEWFTFARAAALRQAATDGRAARPAGDAASDSVQWTAAHQVIQHPYVGYVHAPPEIADPALPISTYGFHGDRPPLPRRAADRYVVAIMGGSVALHFGLYAHEELAAALGRSTALAGRRVEIVNLALGGYKQPQQLLLLQLLTALGGEFDCVVNLDGFNEVALVDENVPLGVPGWYPRSWARLLDANPTPAQQLRLGRLAVLGEERQAAATAAATLWWSPLRQVLWWWTDVRRVAALAECRAEIERAAAAPNPACVGPGTEGLDLAASRRRSVEIWRRCSQQMHTLCEANGTCYVHFLQPNQYVPGSKPIGAEEARVAIDPGHRWRDGVLDGYPLLQQAGRQLRASGVGFTDLSAVFEPHAEPLYTDTCCHFSRRGHLVVVEHVAAAIRSRLELGDVELAQIKTVPEHVTLRSPLEVAPLRVIGVAADGRRVDLTGVGFGVQAQVSPDGALQVGPDGAVRALCRGDAVLELRRGELTATVGVSASWADLFVADDQRAAADGSVPGLTVAVAAEALDVVLSALPAGMHRLLAIGRSPLPETPHGVDPFGLQLIPLALEGDSIRLSVPRPDPALPAFVRCYLLDARSASVAAASHTVVVSPTR